MSGQAARDVKIREMGARHFCLEGIDSRDAAAACLGGELYIERSLLPPMQDGEILVSDLLGKIVRDASRGMLGTVVEVVSGAANDCLEIKDPQGRSFLIPMTEEVIVSIGAELQVKLLAGLHPDEFEEI